MNLRESSGIALGALRANKMRSFLTLLGTIIGVASVIAVLSFVEGLNRFVSQKLLNAGANVFWVDKWGVITSQEAWEDAQKRPDLTMDDVEAIREARLPHVQMVVAMDDGAADIRYRSKRLKNVKLRGRGAGYEVVDDLTIDKGRHLSEIDDQRRSPVAVVGPEIADEFFPGLDPLGRWLRIGDQRFQIVGVTQAKGKVLGSNEDLVAYIPVRTFIKYKRERGSVQAAVKSADQAALASAQQEVRNVVRGRHHLAPGAVDDFGITTSETLLELWHNLTGGIFIVTIGVAAISLVVGGIVIMNIMLVSVTERTREIGVRKALGARRRDIMTQFLVEATTLSLSGGLIGIALGIGLALLVGAISPLPAAVSIPAVIMGILMSSMIGIFFGSYPAFRAARLDPIEALRYE
jgi:putative ABC transport system permease protein